MEIWKQGWQDSLAGLKSSSALMVLADLKGEGEYNLVIADFKKKLRVYKGSAISWESVLLNVPSAVAVFTSSMNDIPNLAVASGNSIFIYKNSRPYFKFTLQKEDLPQVELDIWESLKNNEMDPLEAWNLLLNLRETCEVLSQRTLELLSYDKDQDKVDFIDSVKLQPLVEFTCITCLSSIKRELEHETAISQLVIGTEHKKVHILEASGSQIGVTIKVPGVPAFVVCTGQYCVEYKVLVATREAKIFTVKNGSLVPGSIELETPPTGLVVVDRSIFVGSNDKKVHCYHSRGRKLYTLYMPDYVAGMCLLKMWKTRVFKGLLVGLLSGEVRLYKDKVLLSRINLEETITGLSFGILGKEEGALVANLKNGGIVVRCLEKAANLEGKSEFIGPPREQEVPLNVPTKSKLYLEQAERERQHSTQMYKGFVKDLTSIRYRAALEYFKAKQSEPQNSSQGELRLDAYVQGLGPLFTIVLEVQNLAKETLTDVRVGLCYETQLYEVLTESLAFPCLVPELKYKKEIHIKSISGVSDNFRVCLFNKHSSLPIVSALFVVPACEE